METNNYFYGTGRVIVQGFITENDKRDEECRLLLQKIKDHSRAGGAIRILSVDAQPENQIGNFSCTVLCDVTVERNEPNIGKKICKHQLRVRITLDEYQMTSVSTEEVSDMGVGIKISYEDKNCENCLGVEFDTETLSQLFLNEVRRPTLNMFTDDSNLQRLKNMITKTIDNLNLASNQQSVSIVPYFSFSVEIVVMLQISLPTQRPTK